MINNQDRIATSINQLELEGVEAVGDDGSVCVRVAGNRERVLEVANTINTHNFDSNGIGDGVQEGSIFINGDEAEIHDELFELIS